MSKEEKTFTAKEIHEALQRVQDKFPDNPAIEVAYIIGDIEAELDIL